MKMNIKNNIDKEYCVGCGVCSTKCPTNAICMKYNNEGFLYPIVNSSKCIDCSVCYNKCPIVKKVEKNKINNDYRYVIQLKDKKALLNSSSGGVAYGISKMFIENGGYVVGCILNEEKLPEHIITNSMADIKLMQGSKYVQSYISNQNYKKILQLLERKYDVLFIGTPCQIAGLRTYLDKDYKNLLTIDLICHGVASPGVYLNYIKNKEKVLKEKIIDIKFRDKEVNKYPNNHSFSIITSKGKMKCYALKNPYASSFYHNRILRESCYKCIYSNENRISDITIGDYGKINNLPGEYPFECGYSIVYCNTDKGKVTINNCSKMFTIMKLDGNYTQINLSRPTVRPKNRDKMKIMKFDINNPTKNIGYKVKITFIDRIKNIIPQDLKDYIKLKLK